MQRWRARILVAGLGLAGPAARADDFDWRPVGPAPAPPVAAPAPPVQASDRPASGWQSFPRSGPDAPPALDSFPGDPVFRPASTPLDVQPVAPRPSAVAPPSVGTAYPYPVVVTAPAMAEPLPAPRTLSGRDGIEPKPDVLSAPKELPSQASPQLGTGGTPDATRMWGGYGPMPLNQPVVVAGGGDPPTRHRTFGSEPVTLSRDYHFLDAFGSAATDQARAERQARWAIDDTPATDRFLIQTEYLLWWVQPAKIPALATTGPTPPPGQLGGVLGQAGTQLLLGPGSFGSTARNGFRIRGGYWFGDHAPGLGIDGSYFFLGKQSSSQTFDSNQFPVITRPFFAPNPIPSSGLPGEFGERVASPGRSTGTLVIDNDSDLWGADLNLKCCICRTCNYSAAWFGGFRFLALDENLSVTENILGLNGNPDPPGTQTVVRDSFGVKNRFYGPQVGYAVGRRFGRVSLDGRASVALGATTQELNIDGFQRTVRPGQAPLVFRGGLLATGPNLGNFSQTAFSVVPEVTLNVGYQLTPTLRTYVGYNFLYWSNVIRPGDQIDRVVDLSFVPNVQSLNGMPVPASGQLRPRATFNESDLWIQGVQFGAELKW